MKYLTLINAALVALAFAAARTATTYDDKFVEFLRVVVNSPEVLEWLDAVDKDDIASPPPGMVATLSQKAGCSEDDCRHFASGLSRIICAE